MEIFTVSKKIVPLFRHVLWADESYAIVGSGVTCGKRITGVGAYHHPHYFIQSSDVIKFRIAPGMKKWPSSALARDVRPSTAAKDEFFWSMLIIGFVNLRGKMEPQADPSETFHVSILKFYSTVVIYSPNVCMICAYFIQACVIMDFCHQLYGTGPDDRPPEMTLFSLRSLTRLLEKYEHDVISSGQWTDAKSSMFVVKTYDQQVSMHLSVL